MNFDFKQAQDAGLGGVHLKGFMAYDSVGDKIVTNYDKTAKMMAQDSALTTSVGVGVPAPYVTYLDPQVVPILFGAMNATQIFGEVKKGDWADKYETFGVSEYAGSVTPYSDFADGVSSSVNYEFPVRENFVFQTTIKFGDREEATAAKAKLAYGAEKQRAAAFIIAKASNQFYLYGVAGKQIYGMLNDPNLNATETPISIDGKSTWEDKVAANPDHAANIIFNDVAKLVNTLIGRNGGHLNETTEMVLAISPKRYANLSLPNTFGLTAKTMLKDNFPNLRIVQLPELSTAAGEVLYLTVPQLFGVDTAQNAYSEKMRLSRVFAKTTSIEQKAIGGTWGSIVVRPSLIQTLTGV